MINLKNKMFKSILPKLLIIGCWSSRHLELKNDAVPQLTGGQKPCESLHCSKFNSISTRLFWAGVATEGGGGWGVSTPSITPLSLKLDCSNFVQSYFGIR